MLTYKQALKKVFEHSMPLEPRRLPIRECLGLSMAEDIFSPESFPAFDNSAVDGYAIAGPFEKFKLIGEIRAGDRFLGRLKAGEAVRIFTGALVPPGTEAVVMQENAERMNGTVSVLERPKLRDNIRFRGEDFQKGKLLIRKNTRLAAAHLALLQAIGVRKVLVQPMARVSILVTGSELVKEGEKLAPGKIRDSNTILLEALVRESGAELASIASARDSVGEIRSAIRKALASDLVLVSGGVSVGKYDFVKEALRKEGVREIFWKVSIKPGKPIFFGKKSKTLVFGLPGNPVSLFVTFEEFVKPALARLEKWEAVRDSWIEGRLTRDFRNGSRLHFVRVRCEREKNDFKITPLGSQGSHRIGELARANAILRVKPNMLLTEGQKVSAKLVPRQS